MWLRKIGIVGGLGPYAHIELERRLLQATEEKLGYCPADQELPGWILVSSPDTPDRTAAILSGRESPIPMLRYSLSLLETCDFAIIACNTAHAFLPEIKPSAPLPILDLIEETVRAAIDRFGSEVTLGLIATTGTLETKVYPKTARRMSSRVRFLTLLDLPGGRSLQDSVMVSIYGKPAGIKCGGLHHPRVKATIERNLLRIIDRFSKTGVPAVILGCTELSLALHDFSREGLTLLDPLEVGARAAIDIASGERDLPE